MNGGLRRRLRGCLLVLASAVCYLAALAEWSRLAELPVGEHIVYQGMEEGLDAAACDQILQSQGESGARCALWREKKGQMIENPALSRSTETTVWTVRGSAEVLVTDFVKLSAEDPGGCYVDRSIAEKLFGDVDAVGMEAVWGERRMVIRGILEEGWPLILVRSSSGETAERITLDSEDPESDAGDFLVRHALSGVSYDDSCLPGILKLLLLVFPTVLCADLLQEIFPRLGQAGRLLFTAAVFLCLAIALVGIPLDMIPDRWSNFEFWTAWWRDYRENIRNCLEYGTSGRDTLRLLFFVRGVCLAVLPVVFLPAARREG